MKHTVKIDPIRALCIEPIGAQILITVRVSNIVVMSQTLSPDQAAIMGQALGMSADQAEQARRAVA